MQPLEHRWHVVFALVVAGMVTVISIAEGSLLGGLALSLGVLLVTAGLFTGAAFFTRSTHLRRAAASDAAAGEENDENSTRGPLSSFGGAWRLARSRPWRAGAGVLPVATRAIESRAATLVSPRGHRIVAPHLLLEFNPADLDEATRQWPAELLAGEYAAGYVEHAQRSELKRVAEQITITIAATGRIPAGRVFVTPGFAAPSWLEPAARATVGTDATPVVHVGRRPDQPHNAAPAGVPDPADATAPPEQADDPAIHGFHDPATGGSHPSATHGSVTTLPTAREPGPGEALPAPGPATRRAQPGAPARRSIHRPQLRPGMAPLDAPCPGALLTPLEPGGEPIELLLPTTELGRVNDAGPLAHPAVSRRHARLSHGGQGWTVVDLGSTNGVFINEIRITRGLLTEGDVLGFGTDGPRLRLDQIPYDDSPAAATQQSSPEVAVLRPTGTDVATGTKPTATPPSAPEDDADDTRATERTVALV